MLEITHGLEAKLVRPLEYRAIVAAELTEQEPREQPDTSPRFEAMEARIRELERELEERSRGFASDLELARAEALEAGRNSEREEQAERMEQMTGALQAAAAEFEAGRDRYLAQVEREVVKLALAIAARILHREALMDPLLLSGAVRVALAQLSEGTEVRLKVPAADHKMWSEMLREADLPLHAEIVPDEALTAGECVLEAHPGSVDLGVRGQLTEIERGFFDLLEQRSAISVQQSGKQDSGRGEPTSQNRDRAAISGQAVGHPHRAQGSEEQQSGAVQ